MNPLVEALLADLRGEESGADDLAGARGVSLPYLLAAHLAGRRGPVGILVPSEAQASKLHAFMAALLGEAGAPAWMPAPDADPYEGLPSHPALLIDRAAALSRAAASSRPALLLSARSFLTRVPRRGWWGRNLLLIERGATLDRRELRTALWRMGYRQADLVEEAGEVAFRGGIVDLFPPAEAVPVRVEFFGDEVESLRRFDPSSQRSLGEMDRDLLVHPLSEAVRDEELMERLRGHLSSAGTFGEIRLESLNAGVTYPSFEAEVRQDDAFFGPLTAFLPEAQWVMVEPTGLMHQANVHLRAFADSFVRHRRPPFLSPEKLFLSPAALAALEADPRTVRAGADEGEGSRPPVFPGEPYRLIAAVKERIRKGYRCLALVEGQGTLRRLQELAMAEDLPVLESLPEGGAAPGFYAALAPVEAGAVFEARRWMVLAEKEIFGRGRVLPEARIQRREAFSTGLRDLKVGDPVVHVDHGVGLYQGLETVVRNKVREDYLVLAYAGGGKLLVPVSRMDLIQKYVGPEGHKPPLDKLGSGTWSKNKEKVRKAVKKVAVDLLRLYASRRAAEGFAYPPDGAWQAEFEAQFPFDLTPDQARAVEDVKADLESPRPMDRLICGDVGFGKTEVALRAAFKVVQEGRQVAVLCPTTVLALQHMERFTERFAPFPVKVAMLSRFVTAAEQKRVVKAASEGEVDVLLGTHRLLSKDVVLPRLGLLVVDEEQRFGVNHKEKIKALKERVDVLTLTATPIPRTLQMGLSGILNMSLIQTPPKDRLSIQTSVQPMDRDIVVSAVRRELSRGGQVYYVHNKVETIAAAARRIQEWVPEAKVAVAHGQMGERALEDVMVAFFHGQYDVLVCTTIIENGVDLSRANTLLVENAHALGLTQLYQLRGRIGRSDLPAYAYLLTPPGAVLEGDAERRLETLREFSDLGAGFRVAAVDLELRGAGNLLGAEQSGHMAEIGFELYMRLLEEAVAEAKGESPLSVLRCDMNLGLDLSVPMEYMGEVNQRLAFYRQLATAESEAALDRLAAEVQDRFGPMPEAVGRMVASSKLRLRAERLLVRSVTVRQSLLTLVFDPEAPLDTGGLVGFLAERQGVRLTPAGSLEIGLAAGEDGLSLLDGLLAAAAPSMGATA